VKAGAAGLERSVHVDLGERGYPIVIGYDTLPKLGGEVVRRTGATRAMVVSVPAVSRRHGGAVMRSLREAGVKAKRFDVPDGDRSKNLRQVGRLYEAFLDAGADRSTVVVALGGGVVGDLAGFVAATLLRGLPFVQVPTTVLAMVDASVGGKTGVNLPRGKNLVGAFHQPKLVWIDAALLRTLPPRQRAAGTAEVVKHAAIRDARLFARLERDIERFLALEPEVLVPLLERNCEIKAEVVSRDERETGLRMLLNFGHTLGHAIEALSGYRRILHGEAVSMGMVFAARRSEELGFAPEGTVARLAQLLVRAALPTELPPFPRRAYLGAMGVDKKKREGEIRFVVLRGIGGAEVVPLTPAKILPSRAGRA
jgi:3-dehydroquinate synthase